MSNVKSKKTETVSQAVRHKRRTCTSRKFMQVHSAGAYMWVAHDDGYRLVAKPDTPASGDRK